MKVYEFVWLSSDIHMIGWFAISAPANSHGHCCVSEAHWHIALKHPLAQDFLDETQSFSEFLQNVPASQRYLLVGGQWPPQFLFNALALGTC